MIISRIIEEKSQKKATSVRQEYLSVKTSYTNNTQCQSSQHSIVYVDQYHSSVLWLCVIM